MDLVAVSVLGLAPESDLEWSTVAGYCPLRCCVLSQPDVAAGIQE